MKPLVFLLVIYGLTAMGCSRNEDTTTYSYGIDDEPKPSHLYTCNNIQSDVKEAPRYNREIKRSIIASPPSEYSDSGYWDKLFGTLIEPADYELFGNTIIINLDNLSDTIITELFNTAADNGVDFLLDDPGQEKQIVVYADIHFANNTTASTIYNDITNYFSALYYFYLIPPWDPDLASSGGLSNQEHSARETYTALTSTYRKLFAHPKLRRYLDNVVDAAERNDKKAYVQARDEFERKLVDLTINETKHYLDKPAADLDKNVIKLYLDYYHNYSKITPFSEESVSNIENWGRKMGAIMGQLPLRANGTPTSPGEYYIASTGDIELDNNKIFFRYMIFNHLEHGLQAFADYICSHDVTEFKYSLIDHDAVRAD